MSKRAREKKSQVPNGTKSSRDKAARKKKDIDSDEDIAEDDMDDEPEEAPVRVV